MLKDLLAKECDDIVHDVTFLPSTEPGNDKQKDKGTDSSINEPTGRSD